jgi:hypothetical protein
MPQIMTQTQPNESVKAVQKSLTNPLKSLFSKMNQQEEDRFATEGKQHRQQKTPKRRLREHKTDFFNTSNNIQNLNSFLDRSQRLTKSNDSVVEISTDDEIEKVTGSDDDLESEFKTFKKQRLSSQKPKNCTQTRSKTNLDCIHCNEFICDLDMSDLQKMDVKIFKNQIPVFLVKIMDLINCKSFYLFDKDSVNRAGLASNSDVKFVVNQNTTSLNENLIFNSYIDGTDDNCWQFVECKFCFNIIAFALKFTNSTDMKEILNKYFLINL